ncbi:alpha/beta hydrolase [Nocardia aurea]|uniref:alpha/beta hydrolase n=1 Tax=Nocardia aurea TaxID=2144174 RepID=UPI0033AB2A57
MFGAAGAEIWPCAFWASEPTEPACGPMAGDPSNVLMAQNLRDRETPLSGARQVR